jgi:hypothetical protein
MPTMRVTFSQLTCLYQLAVVIGVSVMCGFFGSYLDARVGSDALAAADGWEDTHSGLTAKWLAAGWLEAILNWICAVSDAVLDRTMGVGGRRRGHDG